MELHNWMARKHLYYPVLHITHIMGTAVSIPTNHTPLPDTTTNDTSSKKRKRPEDDTNETPNERLPKQKTHTHDDDDQTKPKPKPMMTVKIQISNFLSTDISDFTITISTPIPDTVGGSKNEINPFEQMLFSLVARMNGYTIAGYTIAGYTIAGYTIVISSSIIKLPDGIFFNCPRLTAVTLPDTVEEIGVDAFCRCTNLKTVIFSPVLRIIGDYAFAQSGIECSELPPSVKHIGTGAFESCNITHFDLPPSVESIEVDAFASCEVEELTLRSNCTIVEMCLLKMHALKRLTFLHEYYSSQCEYFMYLKKIETIRVYRSTLPQCNRADHPLIQLLHAVGARLEVIDNTKTTPPQCAICLEVVPLDTMLTNCGHVFCVSCCVKAGYLDVSKLHHCPVCKTKSCAKIMIAA